MQLRPRPLPANAQAQFTEAAWNRIAGHYTTVQEWNRNAPQQARDEETMAILELDVIADLTNAQYQSLITFLRERGSLLQGVPIGGYHPIATGILGQTRGENIHAESDVYNQIWEWAVSESQVQNDQLSDDERAEALETAVDLFHTVVKGGRMMCVEQADPEMNVYTLSHKPSCFLCSALADTFQVTVERKDTSAYQNYQLPFILRYGQFADVPAAADVVRSFVGDTAFGIYQRLSPTGQDAYLLNLPGAIATRVSNYNPNANYDTGQPAAPNIGPANPPDNEDGNDEQGVDDNAPPENDPEGEPMDGVTDGR